MTIIHRSFLHEQDKQLMIDLAGRFQTDHLRVIDLPYRLSSWGLDDTENVRLWFDGESLVAWAVLQSPFWAIDYVCHADHPALFKEILAWADGRAQAVMGTPYERSAWFVNVFSGQESRKSDLEEMGFACQSDVGEDSWSKVFMKLSPEPKLYEPPAGFTVRPLGGDVEKYVALHQSVFESKNMTIEWRRRTLKSPLYRPELDLVVESPNGELAAFCICWFNERQASGQVEPLGVHANYRQLGLGRVALSHGVRRLRSMGAKDIFVETDNYRNEAFNLYRSYGFEVIQDVLVYRKDYFK